MNSRAEVGRPWYQNTWPWFIVILLAVSVVASLATVYIAFKHRDVEIDRAQPHASPRVEIDDGG